MNSHPLSDSTAAPRLGQLEIRIMEAAWADGASTVREFIEALPPPALAPSTVQTTLERLTRKGLLHREQRGRAYAYRPRVDRTALIAWIMRDVSRAFATGRMEPLLAGFLSIVDELDRESSRGLLKLLRERLERRG